jgi:hypothetical protein
MAQNVSFDSRLAASPAYPGKNWVNAMVLNTTEGTQQESEYYAQLDERLNYLYLGTWPAMAMNLPYPSLGQRYLECFEDKDGHWLDEELWVCTVGRQVGNRELSESTS